MQNIVRYDQGELVSSFQTTDEGFLKGRAIVTRTGVFTYKNPDGSIRRELRHPDEVFSKASLDSMKLIPITLNHPTQKLVNSENASQISKGQTGESVDVDGKYVLTSLNITHQDAINAVQAGTRGLSLGYRCDIDETPGEYNGETYDQKQTNIRYNHLAVVDHPRAGHMATINLDSKDAIQVLDLNKNTGDNRMSQEDTKKMVTVRVDGIEYNVVPEVERELTKKQERIDAEAKKADEQKAKADMLQAKNDELTEELKKIKEDRSDSAIQEMAKARAALITKSSTLVKDELDDLSDREIMEKVIKARHDNLDVSEKSDEYVAARFDAIIESVKDQTICNQIEKTTTKLDGKNYDQKKADEKMKEAFDAMKEAYKKTDKKDGGK